VWVTRHDIVVNTVDYVVLAYYGEASVESGLASVEALAGCGARGGEKKKNYVPATLSNDNATGQ
jgi:hypothetical protein